MISIRSVIEFVKTHKHVWLALYFVAFIIAFFTIESLTPTEGYWVTDLPVDDYIPFIPQFVWGYVLWFPLFAVVGLPMLIWDGEAFKRWMYYTMTVLTATLIFDVIVPNGQHLRPDIEADSLSTWMLTRLWMADTPTNVFPSMHVLGCIGDAAAAFDSRLFKGKWRWIILAACLLCAVSTVLVKQHAYIDSVAAIVFAIPVFLLFYGKRFFGKKRLEA